MDESREEKCLDTFGRFLRSNAQMSQVYRSLAKMEEDAEVETARHRYDTA